MRRRRVADAVRRALITLAALGAALVSASVARAAGPAVEAAWRVLSQPPGLEGRTELALTVTIAPGWHVNAHDPDRSYLIPTELELEPPAGARVAGVRYPEAVVRTLAFAAGKPLRLYEGAFTIGVRLEGAARGNLTGGLRYQACNDETCLPPRMLPVSLALGSREAGAGSLPPRALRGASPFERWMRDRGLLATLMLAALFGVGLNLTPCVYPLISVTIAYFGGQSGNATGRVVLLASAYVLGIAVTFSALGVSAALSGGLFGSALQQPLVLAGVALVLVALAASNFGLWQFRAPSALTRRAGKASAGVVGALAMGLTMGVVAAPCVGPIVVALLLFVAARQDAVLGFALFFALAVGMGAPYVALAVAAESIKRLPRSGEWLAWIEHLFGFVLLGMALYFIGPLLGDEIIDVALPALVAIAGLYLGFVDRAGRSLAAFATARRALGVLTLAAAVWLAVPRHAESAIPWQPFSPAALAAARQSGKPAIVDFTASWCVPCRENDTVTFTDAAVGAEASRFVMLRADVTEMTAEAEDWIARYEVLGVPTIIFFGSDGAEEARTEGFVEPQRFLTLMRERR